MEPLMERILRLGPKFGRAANIRPQKVVVEFSSVNIGKPLHLGHLRSTIHGHFVRRINEMMGHEVVSINYIGDWGSQFGSLIQGFKMFGNRELLQKERVNHLLEVYVKIHALRDSKKSLDEKKKLDDEIQKNTRRLEEGDKELLQIWREFKEISLEELQRTYQRMGIDFDVYQFESDFVKSGKEIVQKMLSSNKAQIRNRYVFCKANDQNVILLTSEGSTLYITRDIAAALARKKEFDFDRIHYVVDESQAEHFKNLEYILKKHFKCDWIDNSQPWGLRISCGRVDSMSTRQGSIVLLQNMLNKARDSSISNVSAGMQVTDSEEVMYVADKMGLSRTIEAVSRISGLKPMTFAHFNDPTLGNVLQYCYARLWQLEKNATQAGLVPKWSDPHFTSLLNDDKNFRKVVTCIEKSEAKFLEAYETASPSCLIKHANSLRANVSKMLARHRVTEQEDKELAQMLFLTYMSARQVLDNIFHTIGIPALKKV